MSTEFKKIKRNKGAAMLISVVFFLFISLAIVAGLVPPVVREFRIASNRISSGQSYFLAESGVEDAYYRIKNNMPVASPVIITLNNSNASTSITDVGTNQKTISSLGDVSSLQRTSRMIIKTGAGVVFKYGTQAGKGGIHFANNAGLYGSLYSNGDIIGSNGAFITGDAFVANAPAISSDQSNGVSGTPPYNIIFGNANITQDFSQGFRLASDGPVNKAQFYIKKVGSPSNATVRITTSSSGHPSTTVVATGTLNANLVSTNYGWIDVTFSTNPQMITGVDYWLVIDGATSASNYYTIAANTDYVDGQAKIGQYSGTWNNVTTTGLDGYFNIFLGGVTGLISNMDIGTDGVGNAHAHTVIDSTVTGTLYCQVGSSNDKACNTTKLDPAQEALPVSDANINDWKADAEAGGVTNGSLIIAGIQSLGPRKIIGDLTVNGTLTITDTIWVTGNISINGTVKLAASYLATTGMMIADGSITMANNSVFIDSGTPGSYIMLLTTSSCDSSVIGNPCGGADAINASNNSDLIIANAQNGSIHFNNNAAVKEMVANRIYLANNATVSYGSGLINVNFTSGPSGGWGIDSWEESQ